MPVFFLSVPFVSVVVHITHENSIKNQAEPLLRKRVTSRRNEDYIRLERRAECRPTTSLQALSHHPQEAAIPHGRLLLFKSLLVSQNAWTRSSPRDH